MSLCHCVFMSIWFCVNKSPCRSSNQNSSQAEKGALRHDGHKQLALLVEKPGRRLPGSKAASRLKKALRAKKRLRREKRAPREFPFTAQQSSEPRRQTAPPARSYEKKQVSGPMVLFVIVKEPYVGPSQGDVTTNPSRSSAADRHFNHSLTCNSPSNAAPRGPRASVHAKMRRPAHSRPRIPCPVQKKTR